MYTNFTSKQSEFTTRGLTIFDRPCAHLCTPVKKTSDLYSVQLYTVGPTDVQNIAGLNAGIGAAPRHRAAVMTRTRRQNERERGHPCVPLDAMKFKSRCHNTSTVVYKGVPHDTLRSHAVAFAREAYHF